MHPLTQLEFDRRLANQRLSAAIDSSNEIAQADLSDLHFTQTDLDGTRIAMSRLPANRFDTHYSLNGVSWIGNDLQDCAFVGVAMNKCELLDCRAVRCLFAGVSLFRADLSRTVFEECHLTNLDLSQDTCLIGVSFKHCVFESVKIREGLTLTMTGSLDFDSRGEPVLGNA